MSLKNHAKGYHLCITETIGNLVMIGEFDHILLFIFKA